jgi:hypothetical protein
MSCKDGCRCKYCGENYDRESQGALIEELFAKKKGLREEVAALKGDHPAVWWQESEGPDGEWRCTADPTHPNEPHLFIQAEDDGMMVQLSVQEKEGADIVVELRVAVAERAFVTPCSRCDGDGQTEAGTCEWCAGDGVSARDEAQRIATALYGAWLRGWL